VWISEDEHNSRPFSNCVFRMHKTRNNSQCKSPPDTEFYTAHYINSQANQNLKAKYMSVLAPKLKTFLLNLLLGRSCLANLVKALCSLQPIWLLTLWVEESRISANFEALTAFGTSTEEPCNHLEFCTYSKHWEASSLSLHTLLWMQRFQVSIVFIVTN